jgi:hypothetical protein
VKAPAPPDDLIGDIIAEVARRHGVAIGRDDPILAVVLLNQAVLRRYLEEVVTPAAEALRTATDGALAQVEQLAQAQALWLEQVSLKDRAGFLDEQKTLHERWKTDMQALIEAQSGALQRVVVQTVALVKAHAGATQVEVAQVPRAASKSFDARAALGMTLLASVCGAGLALASAWLPWGQ